MKTTPNKLIHIGNPIEFDHELFLNNLNDLYKLAYDEESNIRDAVKALVSTYQYEPKNTEEVGIKGE